MGYETTHGIGYGLVLDRNCDMETFTKGLVSVVPSIDPEEFSECEDITEIVDHFTGEVSDDLHDSGLVITEIGNYETESYIAVFANDSFHSDGNHDPLVVSRIMDDDDMVITGLMSFIDAMGVDASQLGWFFFKNVF